MKAFDVTRSPERFNKGSQLHWRTILQVSLPHTHTHTHTHVH